MADVHLTPAQEAAFWSKVLKTDDCWKWIGPVANDYGYIVIARKLKHAHRVAYVLAVGEQIPSNRVIKHVCGNRLCVNPAHFRLGTKNEHGTERKQGAENRFVRFVNKTESCWLWTGHLESNGYGTFKDDSGKVVKAHRYAYQLWSGEIPSGLSLDHLCRVRRCVNPAHLEPVTHAENVLRGESPAAKQARQTHCKRGHELTPENTYTSDGGRHCRSCHRDRARR